jgi:hypothetical protein
MKIILNDYAVRRVVSNDGSCTGCIFKKDTPCCNPRLVNLCTTKDICYIFLRLSETTDSIFFI